MTTPGQTVGPFFGTALPYAGDAQLVPPGSVGAISLWGRVLDGGGEPVPDALVEVWQRGPDGGVLAQPGSLQRDGATFTGWGRAATDRTGTYRFSTLRPGAGFFALAVFARGLLDRLLTRAYLPGASDEFLAVLPDDRRATLMAEAVPDGYRFDIRLQGAGETVFLHHR